MHALRCSLVPNTGENIQIHRAYLQYNAPFGASGCNNFYKAKKKITHRSKLISCPVAGSILSWRPGKHKNSTYCVKIATRIHTTATGLSPFGVDLGMTQTSHRVWIRNFYSLGGEGRCDESLSSINTQITKEKCRPKLYAFVEKTNWTFEQSNETSSAPDINIHDRHNFVRNKIESTYNQMEAV